MLNIAICDNDVSVCNQLQNMLLQIQDMHREEYNYVIYEHSKELIRELQKNKVNYTKEKRGNLTGLDVIFLDIEMPEVSGIEVARYIREITGDDHVMIVFISSFTSYALQLFEVHPIDFIVKPIELHMIEHLFEKIYRIMGTGNEYFSFQYNKEKNRVLISNIMYIESESRKILIHTREEVYHFYGKISEISEDPRFERFIQIHKSIMVNYQYIVRIKSDSVEISRDIVLPISQQNRKNVMKRFLEMESK